jgi:hypothetical protein
MNNPKRYTVTAALPYVNGPKHIGHLAGAYLPADIYVRYRRLRNDDVVFVCGSDELGTAITIQALKEKMTPRDLVDKYHQLSKDCFERLDISFDIYHRTSEQLHFETAQAFFQDFYDKGLFEERTTQQYYDSEMKSFLADRYIQGVCPNCSSDKAYGDQCESCGKSLDPLDLINPISVVTGNTPTLKSTTNWYLQMEKYEDWITEWLVEGKKDTWKSNIWGSFFSDDPKQAGYYAEPAYGFGETGIDFLSKEKLPPEIKTIITNPPFKLAEDFVEKAFKMRIQQLALLCKLSFLEGQKRKIMYEKHRLSRVLVFSKRQTMTRNGELSRNGGMIAFAWFIWDYSYLGRPTISWI